MVAIKQLVGATVVVLELLLDSIVLELKEPLPFFDLLLLPWELALPIMMMPSISYFRDHNDQEIAFLDGVLL